MAKASNNVTAWTLDESVAAAADGATIPGVPGIWRHGEAVTPEAFGMKVGEFEELVERLSLPLVKVTVSESKALTSFRRPEQESTLRLESAPSPVGGAGHLAGAPVDGETADAAEQGTNRAVLEGTADRVEAIQASDEEATD